MERLRAGYCVRINPFNRNMRQYISFSQCNTVVFWSKNPAPLIPFLTELAGCGIKSYFQFTLNEYVAERLEPNVPSLERRIATFMQLSDLIGRANVVWRFDPIFLGEALTIERILEKIRRLGQHLSHYTEKLVFSFADIDRYKKVQNKLRQQQRALREPSPPEMHALAQGLAELNARFSHPMMLASCAEKIDLSEYGIQHNCCVGTPGAAQCDARLKDPGQRRDCGCLASKDIGGYGTCPHMCVYCYANPAEALVASNMARLKAGSESLLPGGRVHEKSVKDALNGIE